MKLSDAMGQTSKAMGNMNKLMKPEDIARTMQEFEKASTKLDMSEEVSKYRSKSFQKLYKYVMFKNELFSKCKDK